MTMKHVREIMAAARLHPGEMAVIGPARVHPGDDGSDHWACILAHARWSSMLFLGPVKAEPPAAIGGACASIISVNRADALSHHEADQMCRTLAGQLIAAGVNLTIAKTELQAARYWATLDDSPRIQALIAEMEAAE